jgi:hypothetical protein
MLFSIASVVALSAMRAHDAFMSYDLAVWEGSQPSDDVAAGDQYESLMDLMESDELGEPTPRIRAYVEALLARWPDIDEVEDGPWAVSGLMGEASGPLFYFPMVFSRADEASAFAAALARDHGLVCYDPQMGCLR